MKIRATKRLTQKLGVSRPMSQPHVALTY